MIRRFVLLCSVLVFLTPGCGFQVRVPFVGISIRVLDSGVTRDGEDRIVTQYSHDGRTDQLEIHKGRVHLNGVDHGPVEMEDEVSLRPDGVFVNGRKREPVGASGNR